MNIRETVLEIIRRRENAPYLIDGSTDQQISYAEFHRRACAAAAALQLQGLCKGDRVAVSAANCTELAIFYFACIYLGVVIVPVNPSLSRSDVQFILDSCNPAMVVGSATQAELLQQLHANARLLREFTFATADTQTIDCLDPLASSQPDDIVVIMYTSGTSAKPKGLAHRIGSMFRNADAMAATQGIDENSRFYLTLSMSYMGGFYNVLLLPFLCGASVVVDNVFDARSSLHFWEKAKAHSVNTLWMAPTVLAILLRMDRGRTGEEYCRSSVRKTFVGFAPLAAKVKSEFEARYGTRLTENYGLSETLFVTARCSETLTGQGYVGETLPGIDLRIVDDLGCPLAPGIEGEIQIQTPDLMQGYLDSKGGLSALDPSTWFPTGDIGRLDGHGALSVTGRKKDVIIRGGVNISPAAIEECLLQVAGVADVAAVSIPHELYGEDTVAVVKLDAGIQLESILHLLTEHSKDNLAPHQQPARYISIDEFPRTANGKVQKSRLRDLVAEKLKPDAGFSLRKSPLAAESISTP